MTKISFKLVVVLYSFLYLGCVTSKVEKYIVPSINENVKLQKTVNIGIDKAWQTLVQKMSQTYFGIEQIDKESGIIILSFTSNNPSDFITGGKVEGRINQNLFNGEYIDYIRTVGKQAENYEENFSAKANITIFPVSDSTTTISVNIRYGYSYRFSIKLLDSSKTFTDDWVFDSKKCDEHVPNGTNNMTRKFCSKLVAESDLLSLLD